MPLNIYPFNQHISCHDIFLHTHSPMSFFSSFILGLCCSLQTATGVETTLQENPQLLEDGAKAEEPGNLCAGENH